MESIFANAFASELANQMEKDAFLREGVRSVVKALRQRRFKGRLKKQMRNMTPEQKQKFLFEGAAKDQTAYMKHIGESMPGQSSK